MTLQSSGVISMNDITIELGRASGTSINLNETAARALAGVTSGQIRLSDFYGKSKFTIGFDNSFNVRDRGTRPFTTSASINLNSDGTASSVGNSILSTATRWGTPTIGGIGSQYEALIQVIDLVITADGNDGITFAGANIAALGNTAWYSLSSTRSLNAFASTFDFLENGGIFAQGNIYIRQIADNSNIISTSFTITSDPDF